MEKRVCACLGTCLCLSVCTCVHACLCVHTYARVCACVCICVCTHADVPLTKELRTEWRSRLGGNSGKICSERGLATSRLNVTETRPCCLSRPSARVPRRQRLFSPPGNTRCHTGGQRWIPREHLWVGEGVGTKCF